MTDVTKIVIAGVDQASEAFARVQSSAERLRSTYAKLAAFMTAGIGVGALHRDDQAHHRRGG
jgi:putative heme degradation protein